MADAYHLKEKCFTMLPKGENRMTWKTWIDTEPLDTANETVRKLYHDTRRIETGRPPDLVRLTSLLPKTSNLLFRLNREIHDGADGLTVREQEIAALVVSAFNG
jgi:hypothetical protein